jgi:signal transduction histidine kinase/CheY-like chemotaxis protein
MMARLLLVALERETDIVLARKRTRKLAELVGFDAQDQTRITTAVSEIVRNAFEYAGQGKIEFRLTGSSKPQLFQIIVSDHGPGIANLAAILDGSHRSTTGMGLGLIGAHRLMDEFHIETEPGVGTTVEIAKRLPGRAPLVTAADLRRIAETLAADGPADPMEEIRQQNQLILSQFEELKKKNDDLRHLNQELQDTNRGVVALYAELDERADHLRRADELKSKFLSHMSHEFRTPLNSILALSRLLLSRSDGELTAEQETQIEFIRKSAGNLTELVNDLLDLAKVAAGKTVVTPTEFSADGLFGALRGMLRPLLVGDAVSLVFDDASNMPMLVTDEGKVSQILRNFISNALKFTEAGMVQVTASYAGREDLVTFSVRDTGLGIAESDIELIFQEFGQVAHPIQSRIKGTGLGLPLSKKLAELLGGRITVKSELGRGSIFSVVLPRVYAQGEAQDEFADDWELLPNRIPILVVEDNPADAFVIERAVASSAYQPLFANSVAQAKRALQRVKPAAIVTDVLLFGDESWRLLLGIKSNEASHDIPVIVISSTGDDRKAQHLGADEYLAKPVDARQLVTLLDRLTGRQPVTRVLLVDDEEVTRYLVRQLLPRSDFQIIEAANGSEGLIRLREDQPDIVILDLNMPEMDGFQFLEQVAADESSSRIPAIVLTSMVLGQRERSRLDRASVILSKSELSAVTLVEALGGALATVDVRRVG